MIRNPAAHQTVRSRTRSRNVSQLVQTTFSSVTAPCSFSRIVYTITCTNAATKCRSLAFRDRPQAVTATSDRNMISAERYRCNRGRGSEHSVNFHHQTIEENIGGCEGFAPKPSIHREPRTIGSVHGPGLRRNGRRKNKNQTDGPWPGPVSRRPSTVRETSGTDRRRRTVYVHAATVDNFVRRRRATIDGDGESPRDRTRCMHGGRTI